MTHDASAPDWAEGAKRVIHELHQAHEWPGLACMVRHKASSTWTMCAGMASPSLQAPVSPATLFHTGSVGKHMTAVSLLAVAEQGLLTLDDAIGQHLPALPSHWRAITVRQLLQQTSGIDDYIAHVPDDRGLTNAQVYERIAGLPLLFTPGACWSYSNTNYRLVGDIAAACAGTSFAHLMSSMFARAGLMQTLLDDGEELVAHHAEPCAWIDGRWRRANQFYAINVGSADGGVAISAVDAAAWDRALWDCKLVGQESLDLMQQPTHLTGGLVYPYGFGLALQAVDPVRPTVGHSGIVPGFMAHYFHAPTEGLGVMVMTNGMRAPGCRQMAEAVAEHICPGLTAYALRDHDPDLEAEDLQVKELLFRGEQKLDPEAFAANLQPLLAPSGMGRGPLDFTPNGKPTGFSRIQSSNDPTGSARLYRIRWGGRVEHVRVARLSDGRIWRFALT